MSSTRSRARGRDSGHDSTASRARDSDHFQHDEDLALRKFISEQNLPYLGVASGLTDKIPGASTPATANTMMWQNEMIYKLRSELVRLGIIIDKQLRAIESEQRACIQDVVDKMVEAEQLESLFLPPISGVSEASFRDYPSSRSPSPAPTGETKPAERRPRMSSERRMSLARAKNDAEDLSAKVSLQDSLWNNMELFLKPVSNLSQFSSVLAPPRTKAFDMSVLGEPFGPHYSGTLPRQAEGFASDPMKSRLILPPSVFEESHLDVNTAHLHSRLVCAFVRIPLGDEGEDQRTDDGAGARTMDLRKGDEVLEQLRRSSTRHQTLKSIMDNGTPTPEGMGTTAYGQLSFGEKLKMELAALQICGTGLSVADSNCPVMKCMAYHLEQQGKVTERANRKRKMIAEMLKEKKAMFEERVRIKNNWDAGLKRFLTQQEMVEAKAKAQKAKAKAKQKKKDRKSRDSSESDNENGQ